MAATTGINAKLGATENNVGSHGPSYVIVSPVRDEERYIEDTIRSVIRQTIRPIEWIIVDDGSKDRTGRIIDGYAAQYRWIRVCHRIDRGKRIPGTGVMEAFYDGYRRLETAKWNFVVKLDGVEFDPRRPAKEALRR